MLSHVVIKAMIEKSIAIEAKRSPPELGDIGGWTETLYRHPDGYFFRRTEGHIVGGVPDSDITKMNRKESYEWMLGVTDSVTGDHFDERQINLMLDQQDMNGEQYWEWFEKHNMRGVTDRSDHS